MKRPILSSDSLVLRRGNGLRPICPVEEKLPPMLDEIEAAATAAEEEEELYCSEVQGLKKRRLKVEQVRALEKNFEVENKLDPERKARLARDLGLQPRQVAVWFQNRRARWKTKQLERDYSSLRASYDSLSLDCDSLRRDKESLLTQIAELRAKLLAEDGRRYSIKEEEAVVSEFENRASEEALAAALAAAICKDGSSDSDSSVVLNNESSPCEGGIFQLEDSDWRAQRSCFFYSQQLMKVEEHNLGSFFSEEPTLSSWYGSENWSSMDG